MTRETALNALYGDRQVHLSSKSDGIIGESRAWNGAFNTVVKGNLLNRQVNAVALYSEWFLISSYSRQLYIYPNQYALNPISEQIFSVRSQKKRGRRWEYAVVKRSRSMGRMTFTDLLSIAA